MVNFKKATFYSSIILIFSFFFILFLFKMNGVLLSLNQSKNLNVIRKDAEQKNKALPEYKEDESLTFIDYGKKFKISYPSSLGNMVDVKGLEGNFYVETEDSNTKTKFIIYSETPEKKDVQNLNLANIEKLSYPFFNNTNPTIIPETEQVIKKEKINISGVDAFKIKTKIKEELFKEHPENFEFADIERIIVPLQDVDQPKVIILSEEYNIKPDTIIENIIQSFKLIEKESQKWKIFQEPVLIPFEIRYPPNFNVALKKVKLNNEGEENIAENNLNIEVYDSNTKTYLAIFNDKLKKINCSIESIIKLDQSLGKDVKNSKYSLSVFGLNQGGDKAIRIARPLENKIELYLCQPLIKFSMPLNSEENFNQILTTMKYLGFD